jgi:hypothetical protein
MTWLLYLLAALGALQVAAVLLEWAERSLRNRRPDRIGRTP